MTLQKRQNYWNRNQQLPGADGGWSVQKAMQEFFWDVGNAIYLGHVGGYMTEGKICKQYT